MNHKVRHVLVIGGGFSGMATAISLRQHGIKVDLVEIDPEWRVYGAGISLGGATLRTFQKLGFLEDFMREGFASAGTELRTPDGHLLATLPTPKLTETGTPGNGAIMRPALARIMEQKTRSIGGVDIRLGCTFREIRQDESGATVEFTDGETRCYDLVVGADGLYSKTRETLFPEVSGPRYSGQAVWRAVLPRPADITTTRIWTGMQTKVGVNPVSDREMYLFVNEVRPDNNFVDPERFAPSLQQLLEPFPDPVIQDIRKQIPEVADTIIYRPLEGMLMPQPWHNGRVVLIGDAVHATTPHLGSGACIGIEDGIVLAEELAEKPLQQALEGFMQRRWERCQMVVQNSQQLGEIEITGGDKQEHTRIMQASFARLAEPI